MIRLETTDAEPTREQLIEAELPDEMRTALAQMCDLFNVPRSCWLDVPAFEMFETAAVKLKANRMVRRPGYRSSMTMCMQIASDMLGCSYKTIESRLHRARKVSSELKAG